MRKLGIPIASGSEGHLSVSAELKGKYSDFDDDATSLRPTTQHQEEYDAEFGDEDFLE
jgi:hypothetical protein